MQIDETPAPTASLIAPFAQMAGHYTDCFCTENPSAAGLSDLILAFYTQPLFQAERVVLRVLARVPSTDAQAAELAAGTRDSFAVWTVQGRRDSEVLLADASGRTMSWLQADAQALRFGSVVVPVAGRRGKPTLGPVFHSLEGAHKVYARALLSGAARRLARRRARA